MAVRTIKHKGRKRLFEKDDARWLPVDHVDKIRDILHALDTVNTIGEIELFPGWKLHQLKGDLKGKWSITVTGNWRIVFDFVGGDAVNVDYIDYH